MIDIYKKVQLFKNGDSIFLVNMSSVDISTLTYLSYSIQTLESEDGDHQIISSKPVFEIRNIPSQTYMELEKTDIYEAGVIIRCFEKIVWDDGTTEENINIPYIKRVYKLKRTGSIDLNTMTKISRDKVLIRKEPSIDRKL